MAVLNISNAVIEEIISERNTTFVTVSYRDGQRGRQTVRLIVNPRTIILNTSGAPVPARTLREGMVIDAVISSAMTRSIPPQATAYLIRIVRGIRSEKVSTGQILDIDRNRQSFTTIRDRDVSSVIRFQLADDARIFDRFGRPMGFEGLRPGMRVRVRHASFMTASIPPQTTAFEIRVL